MSWKFENTGGRGVRKDWVQEGNVPLYIFKTESDHIRFLVKDFDIGKIARSKKISKEEAEEYAYTNLLWEKWIMPVPLWEHTIPGIQGVRYFSVAACAGLQKCPLCAENNVAKEKGVTDNKMLPYSVRKRFVVPIWSYRLEKLLYLKQSQDFFEEIASYIDKHGINIDFDVFKTGKGFNTKYKAIFLGEAQLKDLDVKPMLPGKVSMILDAETLAKRLGEAPSFEPEEIEKEKAESKNKEEDDDFEDDIPVTDDEDPGVFELPFGSHKGQTLRELFELGERNYLDFLKTKSSGVVQQKVTAFLETV